MSECGYGDNPQQQFIFVKEEATVGTFVSPGSSDIVLVNGVVTHNQPVNKLANEQKTGTRSPLKPHGNAKDQGEITIPVKMVTSGTAGTAPSIGPLLKSFMGKETIDPGVSVTYETQALGTCPTTLSAIYKDGSKVFYITGVKINAGDIATNTGTGDDAILVWEAAGVFQNESWAFYSELAVAAIATDTTITVDDAKQYSGTPLIVVGDDDNSGAGYTVTDINYSTNVITFTPALATPQGIDAAVVGWYPTVSVAAEYFIHSQFGGITADKAGAGAASYPIRTMSVSRNDNYSYVHVKDGNIYPTSLVSGTKIEATGSVDIVSDRSTGDDWYHSEVNSTYNFVVDYYDPLDPNVAGKKFAVEFTASLQKPTHAGDDQTLQSVELMIHDSVLDDHLKLIFT